MNTPLDSLIQLSREIGRVDRKFAILAEGNTSMRLDNGNFIVKASGAKLASLKEEDLVECDTHQILALLDRESISDSDMESALLDSRKDASAKKPSVETLFHAWLLTLENVRFIGHCHPVSVNQVLCSQQGFTLAEKRLFPDEVVCCGPKSVWVPYVDPGLPLAREIRSRTMAFIEENHFVPRLILLQNHGVIALGSSPESVLACLDMASKAAEIFVGAAVLGGPVFLSKEQVARIHTRPDEAHRQRALKV